MPCPLVGEPKLRPMVPMLRSQKVVRKNADGFAPTNHPRKLGCGGGWRSPRWARGSDATRLAKRRRLLQQLGDRLLCAVGLRQSADTGLGQDLVLRQLRR